MCILKEIILLLLVVLNNLTKLCVHFKKKIMLLACVAIHIHIYIYFQISVFIGQRNCIVSHFANEHNSTKMRKKNHMSRSMLESEY